MAAHSAFRAPVERGCERLLADALALAVGAHRMRPLGLTGAEFRDERCLLRINFALTPDFHRGGKDYDVVCHSVT